MRRRVQLPAGSPNPPSLEIPRGREKEAGGEPASIFGELLLSQDFQKNDRFTPSGTALIIGSEIANTKSSGGKLNRTAL